jgi:hypothetical protein
MAPPSSRAAREKAEVAINEEFKADFLAAEGRWLSLACSYKGQHRVSRTIAEFDRRPRVGAINRMLQEHGGVFKPDDITRLMVAYGAVLHQLGLADREACARKYERGASLQLHRLPSRLYAG